MIFKGTMHTYVKASIVSDNYHWLQVTILNLSQGGYGLENKTTDIFSGVFTVGVLATHLGKYAVLDITEVRTRQKTQTIEDWKKIITKHLLNCSSEFSSEESELRDSGVFPSNGSSTCFTYSYLSCFFTQYFQGLTRSALERES